MRAGSYQVIVYPDADHFLIRAESWLVAREAQYNLLLGIACRLTESAEEYEKPILFGTVEVDGQLEGCIFRTPPHKLGLTAMPYDAIPHVVKTVADYYPDIPAVLGPEPIVGAFARGWARVRPVRWVPGMKQRIYRLDQVLPLTRAVGGRMRPATVADLPTVTDWIDRFSAETGIATHRAADMAALLVDHDALVLWDDDGPKSMAGTQGFTEHGVRISYVYTPEGCRGRGYASAVVHDLSRRMLESGRTFCVLYTDLSNPTSNAIYLQLGYVPVEDVRDYNFVPQHEA